MARNRKYRCSIILSVYGVGVHHVCALSVRKAELKRESKQLQPIKDHVEL